MKPEFRIALLGQGFMGKAHSNAYSQAGHFYDLPYRIRRRLLCGRDAANLASGDKRGFLGGLLAGARDVRRNHDVGSCQ